MIRPVDVLVLLPLLALAGCDTFGVEPTEMSPREKPDYGRELAPGELALEKVTDPALYPNFGNGYGEKESLIRAIDATLEYFTKKSSETFFPYLDIDHARAKRSLEVFKEVLLAANSPEELNKAIVDKFEVYRSKGWNHLGDMFFTGYCTPIYKASQTKTAEFQYPLYSRPSELRTDAVTGEPQGWNGGPSPTRAEFDAGALAGRNLEIYWVANKLDAYVIHVQGSAKLELPNGELHTIGYAGKTERPYKGLGASLVEDGKIDKGSLSLFKVRQYFQAHPDELDTYINKNESYVFFTRSEGGPFGSINVPVTAYRTLATDKKVFPRGGVTYAETIAPNESGQTGPFKQFMLDQDTGGAIRSAGRADIYFGVGPQAEAVAGGTGAEGKLWYVYVKPGL